MTDRMSKRETRTLTTQIPQEFIQMIARDRGVTNAELETVFMALGGQSTASIATQLGISDIAVRKRLGEVYKKFNIGGSGPGKLAELKHQLLFLHQSLEPERPNAKTMVDLVTGKGQAPPPPVVSPPPQTAPPTITHTTPQRRQDWGEAPDIPAFYGRDEEMATLKQWILKDGCRLVALLGLMGTGKTTLSVQLAKQAADRFDFVIWRSLRHSPSLEDFITGLLGVFLPANKGEIQESLDRKITRVFEYLRKYRCLLVIDDWEIMLQGGTLAGNYRDSYQEYRDFLQQVGQVIHQSSLLLVSSEAPAELTWLLGNKVRIFKQMNSENIAREVFKEKGVIATERDWKELFKRYRDNLLGIKIVAATISDFFNGNTANFLKATALYSNDKIDNWLGAQIERLSPLEREIMYWLALEKVAVSLTQLREDVSHVSFSELLKNLESLEWRSLIEKSNDGGESNFTLQPLVMKYVTQNLVAKITEELRNFANKPSLDSIRLLKTYDLLLPRGKKSSTKDSQTQSIIRAIEQSLESMFIRTSGYEQLRHSLSQMATMLSGKSHREVGYALENVQVLLAAIS